MWLWRSGPLFLICLVPLILILLDGIRDALGANPVEEITHRTGGWALRLLLLTLALTPIRLLSGWGWVMRYRRMLGLYAFFYACLHLLTYALLDQHLAWSDVVADIAKRPYITLGFAAWVLMVPLALTSTKAAVRRLGSHWRQLHRLAYALAALAVLHFYWLVKVDPLEPILYGGVLAALLGIRVARWAPRGGVSRTPSPALHTTPR